jgi:PAS domain S-box-containing protein
MIKTEDLIPELFSGPKSIVLVTDDKFRIRYVTESIERILGVRPIAVVGRNALDLLPSAQKQIWRELLFQTDNSQKKELTLVGRDGLPIHFDVSLTNHSKNDKVNGWIIHLHNITDQKTDLQKLEDANQHLDHFIFKTTHDLRAPLRSALGLLNLAETSSEPERSNYLRLLKASLLKLDAFIEEVNSFYRNDKLAIGREEIDLRELLKAELDSLANLPEAEGVEVSVDVQQQAKLFSDSIRFRTIFSNILSNSYKYKDESKTSRKVAISALVTSEELLLTVADNGVGIAPEYHQKIFDMFYRANDTKTGTGLGLYIVKDTVERLGGKIQLESKPGVGSTFTISMPNRLLQESI